jgi:hypothetical protein
MFQGTYQPFSRGCAKYGTITNISAKPAPAGGVSRELAALVVVWRLDATAPENTS